MLNWIRVVMGIEGFSIRPVEVNGHPGALGLDGQERVLFAVSFDVADGPIRDIRAIVNPDKLGHLGPVSDLFPRAAVPGTRVAADLSSPARRAGCSCCCGTGSRGRTWP